MSRLILFEITSSYMNPEQTAPYEVHTVCYRKPNNRRQSRQLYNDNESLKVIYKSLLYIFEILTYCQQAFS